MEPQLQNDTYPISIFYCNCTNGLILHHGLMLFLKDYSNFYADVLGFFPNLLAICIYLNHTGFKKELVENAMVIRI